ncbi:NB-ARC domain-containing protein [Streptomyces sp. ME19-01-6]|uniref:NB-ARC domain-containing protein n=1 Tax=Streptomyces sp. ME19-01-6 TaxID=3028686 RepID=UPI0029A3AD3C|nr:NB-ARC domain-containing protein [Streptomyces sp. ME19-01-6]MDX3230958.1 NB-ARC domain-containing protein [Streptomyces sp. ME19-01-6]
MGNEVSGTVHGPVVQAGRLHGGVHFHYQTPPAPPPARVPRQVPAGTASFENRTTELAELDDWLTPGGQGGPGGPEGAGSPRIALLSGLPGVGKRATVRRWVERTRDRFPGGHLYVDFARLRREGAAGGDVSEGLRHCLRSIGVAEEYLSGDLAELTAHYRSHSADRRIVVVLDEVSQPAQVRALIPNAPGSVVLATSRDRLGELMWDGARLMPVEPLSADSGRRLLARLCGEDRVRAEPEAAARLVEWCGGLPVALYVVAARLAVHRRLTLSALAGELADENRRLAGLSPGARRGEARMDEPQHRSEPHRSDSLIGEEHTVSAVFTVAYRDLPQDAARLYRLLGASPGRSFDTGGAAAVGGLPASAAAPLLGALERASLLDVGEDGRYRFHDLVRLHARDLADADEREAALARAMEYHLTGAAFADRAIMGRRLRIADHRERMRRAGPDPFEQAQGGAKQAALAWLEAERADALAVLRAAAAHGGLDRQTWQLAEALTALYLHHRHLAEWIESGELGAAAAARDGQPAAEARLRALLSRPLMDLGEFERAGQELETAVLRADGAAAAAPEDRRLILLRGSVREFSGRYWDRFDPARAAEAYDSARALSAEAGDDRGVAIALYFMGCSQSATGRHEDGLATLRDGYELLRGLGDVRMAARAQAAIGDTYEALGRTAEAVEALEEAARALRAQEATHYEAQALETLAGIAERAGDTESLRRHLHRAVEIHEAGGSPRAPELRARLEAAEGSEG